MISLALGAITWGLLIFLNDVSSFIPKVSRLFTLLGGTTDGFIQFACYVAFFYGILELRKKQTDISTEMNGFSLGLLPSEDQLVLSADEVADIKLNLISQQKNGQSYMLSDFIKKACTQYRNDNSVAETLHVLDVQMDNSKEQTESSLSMVRYMISAIMSLGFIGTLLGLTSAIGNAHLAQTEEGMPILTAYLNAAFDTTLVALLLGLILNYLYHGYIESLDSFYAKTKTYIVDNLISRIYNPKSSMA